MLVTAGGAAGLNFKQFLELNERAMQGSILKTYITSQQASLNFGQLADESENND